jgi:SAM-dependent methyltransferase
MTGPAAAPARRKKVVHFSGTIPARMIYGLDLAYVHHAGFSEYARRAAPEIARLLKRRRGFSPALRHRSLVVEFGCGGGITARYLTEHGFKVFGVDQSPAMVKLARSTAPRARFAVGSLATTPIPRCGAIIALGEVVNYLVGQRGPAAHDRAVFRFFSRAARALDPGGLLLFDFMESARHRTFDASTRSRDDWAVVASARAEGSLLTRHISTVRCLGGKLRLSNETHRVRLSDRRTMIAALRRAGFDVTIRRSIGRVPVIRGDAVAFASID